MLDSGSEETRTLFFPPVPCPFFDKLPPITVTGTDWLPLSPKTSFHNDNLWPRKQNRAFLTLRKMFNVEE